MSLDNIGFNLVNNKLLVELTHTYVSCPCIHINMYT